MLALILANYLVNFVEVSVVYLDEGSEEDSAFIFHWVVYAESASSPDPALWRLHHH